MISDFSAGITYCFTGFRLISKPGLRRFVLVPFLINTIIFSAAIWLGKSQYDNFLSWLIPAGDSWWIEVAQALLWIFFALIVFIILFFTFTLVSNLLGSPFNGLLSEKVEGFLSGKPPQDTGGFRAFISTILPSILSELKKILYFLLIGIAIFLLMLIPGLNVVSPFIWAAFTSWMLALEYTAYPMENSGIFFSRARKELKKKKALTFGFGLAVMAVSTIPLINFFVMPAAIAGATAMWVDRLKDNGRKN